MSTAIISIEVDAEAARAFSAASVPERRKLELLLALRLKQLTTSPARPLSAVMDEIGADAEANGLSLQVLESLLHDE